MGTSAAAFDHSSNHSNILELFDKDNSNNNKLKPRKLSVLIVDDSEIDFQIIKRTLKRMETYDTDVYYAADVVEAREITANYQIDMALIDYCLGLDSGIRAVNEIGGRCGRIPVIMVSGMPGPEVPQMALRAGAINHINKNEISPALLDSIIRSALYTHRVEAQLQRTIVELNKADQAKNDFFSRMSHDLKTPLNAILGFSDAIKSGVYGESTSEGCDRAVENIHDAGHTLLETINNLIVQASNSQAIKAPEFENIRVGDILMDSIRIVEPFAKSAGHTIVFDEIVSNREINCQVENFTQAITNILSNAIKYSNDPSDILISAAESNTSVEITIKDHGIGMSDADMKKAFQLHGRIEQPAHLAREGTGVGLSIVQDVISNHEGTLEYKSVPGEGTEVKITLPKIIPN